MQYMNGLALRVSVETGIRIGDVLALKGENIAGRKISFTAKKTGKSGVKTISAELERELRRVIHKPGDFVFKGRGKTGHITRQAVYLDLKGVCKRMHLEGQISPHTARKSYAVDIFHEKGLNAVQKELQHRNVSETLLYCMSDTFLPKYTKSERNFEECENCPLLDEKFVKKLAHQIAQYIIDETRGA